MCLLCIFSPSSTHCYDFIVLTSSTYPRKMILVVLKPTHPQPMRLVSARALSSLEVFLEVRKEAVVRKGQVRWFRTSEWRYASFWCVMAALWGQHRLACLDVTRPVATSDCREVQRSAVPWWLQPFQVVSKQNSISVPEDRRQHLAWGFYVLNFFGCGQALLLFFGVWIIYTYGSKFRPNLRDGSKIALDPAKVGQKWIVKRALNHASDQRWDMY
jgi:hypothetical protein